MRNDQHIQNVINKYNKYLTSGQKKAIKKRASTISMQNAKTRSELESSALISMKKTNEYQSSMGLASNLTKAPSSGADEQNRKMPEFHQQNQALRPAEQASLTKYGKRLAQQTIAARRAAQHTSSGRYRVVDPTTGEFMTKADGSYVWTSKKNKYTLEHGGYVSGVSSMDSYYKSKGYSQAQIDDINRDLVDAAQNEATDAAWYNYRQQQSAAKSNAFYGLGSASTGSTTQSWQNTVDTAKKVSDTVSSAFSNLVSALNGKKVKTTQDGKALTEAEKANRDSLIEVVSARKQARDIIQYAADIGAISQYSADTFKTSVNSGSADMDNMGKYLAERITHQVVENRNNAAEQILAATKAVADAQRYASKAARSVYEAYANAKQTGTDEAYEELSKAYSAFVDEQHDAAVQMVRQELLGCIEAGMQPQDAVEAMTAYKAGDIERYSEIVTTAMNEVAAQVGARYTDIVRSTAENALASGQIEQGTLDEVNKLLEAGDIAGAQNALNSGAEQYYREQTKEFVIEAYNNALESSFINKGEFNPEWKRFKALYDIAVAGDSTESWTLAMNAYTDLVQANINARLPEAQETIDTAKTLGLSDEDAAAAIEAFKAGDIGTFYDYLDKTGLEDEPIGYVAALRKDEQLQMIAGISYATYMQYESLSDEDIDAAIESLENGKDSTEVRKLKWMKEYKENIEKGLSIENGDFSTWLTPIEMAKADSMSTEAIDEQIAELGGNREQKLKELNGVKTARTSFANQENLEDYLKMSEDELNAFIEKSEAEVEDLKKSQTAGGNTFLVTNGYSSTAATKATDDKIEDLNSQITLASYALTKKQNETRGNNYKEIVTTPLETMKSSEDYSKVVASAYSGKTPNANVEYSNGKWYTAYTDEEATAESGLKTKGRELVSADSYASLGWSGVYESYYNAQVFKNSEGKYVVYSTVTNSGTPMSPSWAERYKANLNTGMDPDHLKMGEFDTKEEAEAFAEDAENDAYYYSDAQNEERQITGDEADALSLFKLMNDPALLFAGWSNKDSNMGAVKFAAYTQAQEQSETDVDTGSLGKLASEAVKIGYTSDGQRALEKEANKLGYDIVGEAYNWYAYANDDEKNLYAYYCATDLEKAAEYRKSMTTYINERVMNDVKDLADSLSGNETTDAEGNVTSPRKVGSAIASQIATFLLKPMEAAGGLYVLWQRITGEDIDPYSSAFTATIVNTEIRQSHYEQLQKDIENKFGKDEGESFLANASVFLLQNIDSGLDSMLASKFGVGLFGTGASGKAIAAKAFSLSVMGTSAAGAVAQDLTAKGVPQKQAKKLSIAAGLFEALFEIVEVDTFIKGMNDPTKSFTKRLIGHFVNEGVGEGMTDVANLAADIWTRGKQSDMYTEIAQLMEQGYEYKAAAAITSWNELCSIGLSVLGGGLMGAETAVTETMMANRDARAIGGAVQKAGYTGAAIQAAGISDDSGVKSVWDTIRAGYNAQKGYSNLDIGRLNYALMNSDIDTLTAKVNSMVENGDIAAEDGDKINAYLEKLSGKVKTEGKSVAYGVGLDTSDIDSADPAAVKEVSQAAFETVEATVTERTGETVKVSAETVQEVITHNVVGETKVGDGVTVVRHTGGNLTGLQKLQAKIAVAIGKAAGLNVVVHDSLLVNGVNTGNEIHLSLDAQRGFISTLSHELTHWMRTNASAESYQKLESFLRDQANKSRRGGFDELVETELAEIKEKGTYSGNDAELRQIAKEETVCHLCETMLNDETTIRELLQADANVFQQIYQWITDALDAIRNVLSKESSTREKNELNEAEQLVQDLESARDLWYKCLMEAKQNNGAETFTTFTGETITAEDKAKYSEKNQLVGIEPVERTKDLIATHSITLDKLNKLLEMDAMPAPSIGITRVGKSGSGNSGFGDATFIFDRATIDPEIDRRNRLFGADAFTPVFKFAGLRNSVVDAKSESERLADLLYIPDSSVAKDDIVKSLYFAMSAYDGDIQSLVDDLVYDDDIRKLYVAETGLAPKKSAVQSWLTGKLSGVVLPTEQVTRLGTSSKKSDNIVDAMYKGYDGRRRHKAPSDIRNAAYAALQGAIAPEYGGIDELTSDEDRLEELSLDEWKKRMQGALDRINDSISAIGDKNAEDAVAETIPDLINESGTENLNADGIQSKLNEKYGANRFTIEHDALEAVADAVKSVSADKTSYFEAKPERSVGFDEIKFAVVPDTVSAETRAKLDEKGILYETYKAGDNNDRTRVMNSERARKAFFSTKETAAGEQTDIKVSEKDNHQVYSPESGPVRIDPRDPFDNARNRIRVLRSIGSTNRQNVAPADAAQPDLDKAKAAIAPVKNEDGTVTRSSLIDKIAGSVKRSLFGMKDFARALDGFAKGDPELRKTLKEAIEDPFNEAGSKYAHQLKARREAFDAEMKRLGITTPELSAAVQKYGEGGYVDEHGDWQHYTEEDLAKEVGDMAANVKAAADVCRDVYDDYIDELNAMLEKIYPNIIEHAETRHEKLQEYVDIAVGKMTEQQKLVTSIQAKLESQYEALKNKTEGTQTYTNLVNSIAYNEARLDNARVLLEKYTSKAVIRRMQMQQIEDAVASGEELKNRRVIRRADYFHHFAEMEQGFGALMNILQSEDEIDPKLAGKSADTKPRSKWASFLQKRQGRRTELDAIKGMHLYMMEAERKLAFDPFTSYLKDLADGVAQAAQEDEFNGKNTNTFLRWLRAWSNSILGKSNGWDRQLSDSGLIGRKAMDVFNWINARVRSNAVLWNFHSVCVQISNLANGASYVTNPKDWVNGVRLMRDMAKGNDTVNDAFASSGFMTQRYGLDFDEYDEKMGPKKFAAWMLGVGDETAGKLMWFSAYAQYMRDPEAANKNGNGNYRNAVEYADDITRRSTAGRGIGEQPTIMTSKLLNTLAPFQLEVNNTWQNLKEIVGAKSASRFITLEVTTYLMNVALKGLFGDKPLPFDFIDAIVTALTGGDDDEDEEEKNIGTTAKALLQSTGATLLGGLPFSSQLISLGDDIFDDALGDYSSDLYGAGNIGASAVVDTVKGTKTFIDQLTSGKLDSADKVITSLLDNSDWMKLLFPWGGAQAQRSLKAADTMARGYSQRINSEGEAEAQFPYEHGFFKDLRTLAMGKWTSNEGEAYLNGETKALNADQTAVMKEAMEAGMKASDFFSSLAELKALNASKNAEGKTIVSTTLKVLDTLNRDTSMTDEQKLLMLKAKDANSYEEAKAATEAGLSLSDYCAWKLKENGMTKEDLREELLHDKSLTPEQKQTVDRILYKTEDEKLPDYSSATAFVLSTSSDAVKEKTAAMTSLGVKTEKALFYISYDKNDGVGIDKLEAHLWADKDLTAEQKAGMDKILRGSETAGRDYSSEFLYKMSEGGLNSSKYKMATEAVKAGVSEASAEKYINLKGSEVPDETDVNKTRSMTKTEWRDALMADTSLTAEQKKAVEKVVYGTDDDKMPDYSSSEAYAVSLMSDGKKEKATAITSAGLSVEIAKKYVDMEGGKAEVLKTLLTDESIPVEQKATVEKALYPDTDKTRDYSSEAWFELSGMSSDKYNRAKAAEKKGVKPEKALEYFKAADEDVYDAETGHTSSVSKSTVLDKVMADKSMTASQKTAVEKMLYPTTSATRDYTDSDWYYLSSTSSGTEGKSYKYAKLAVKYGIPVSICVKETKEYLRRSESKTGHGSSGGCTSKDTKEICYSLGLSDANAALLYKIYTGKITQ